MQRPELTHELKKELFLNHYYLKEELIAFCKENGLPLSGGKTELTQRIANYLETKVKIEASPKRNRRQDSHETITLTTCIETDFVCSEKHRAFFKAQLGNSFSFNVIFQKWLKNNAGKTYQDALLAYATIKEEKKKGQTVIDQQFEYNTYIRAFFADNQGKTLKEAIRCWKYKKNLYGPHFYEKDDLKILEQE